MFSSSRSKDRAEGKDPCESVNSCLDPRTFPASSLTICFVQFPATILGSAQRTFRHVRNYFACIKNHEQGFLTRCLEPDNIAVIHLPYNLYAISVRTDHKLHNHSPSIPTMSISLALTRTRNQCGQFAGNEQARSHFDASHHHHQHVSRQ